MNRLPFVITGILGVLAMIAALLVYACWPMIVLSPERDAVHKHLTSEGDSYRIVEWEPIEPWYSVTDPPGYRYGDPVQHFGSFVRANDYARHGTRADFSQPKREDGVSMVVCYETKDDGTWNRKTQRFMIRNGKVVAAAHQLNRR